MALPPDRQSTSDERPHLTAALRILLTIVLLVYLAIVLLGPLSNPVGSEHLTIPLAKKVRPVHQALFLGHGYRFFGPDPGPSHILEYRIIQNGEDETTVIGRFPDRDRHWPRLLYHRWFMLSETLYRECSSLPEPDEHRQWLASITQEIESYRQRGELPTMGQLARDRDTRVNDYRLAVKRRDELLKTVARHLLEQQPGKAIELYLIERLIPRPVDVQSGVRLTDPRFLSEPRLVGRFTADNLSLSGDTQ